MRIIYFSDSLPPIIDGVTHTLCRLVDTLENEKIEYRFVSPCIPEKNIGWRDKVYSVKSFPFPWYNYYQIGLPYFQGLEAELNSFRPDMVHVVSPTLLGMYGIQYAKRRSISVVSSYHTHFVSYFSYYGFSRLERWGWNFLQWIYNQCDYTFAPSTSAVDELKEKGIRNVGLWQRGVDLKEFSPSFRSPELRRSVAAAELPILLYVGRLVKEKDLHDLVGAALLLKEWGHRFKLVFVGDGPMRHQLQQQLPDAHFTGYLQGRDLAQWYASADLFVFPSSTETFGNVILEAFASGLPVVAVNQGGVTNLVTAGVNGLLAKPHDQEEFAHHIEVFLNDTAYRKFLSQKAQNTAKQFDWQSVNKKLIDSYHQIADRKKSL